MSKSVDRLVVRIMQNGGNIRIAIVETHAAPAARNKIPGDFPSPLYNCTVSSIPANNGQDVLDLLQWARPLYQLCLDGKGERDLRCWRFGPM